MFTQSGFQAADLGNGNFDVFLCFLYVVRVNIRIGSFGEIGDELEGLQVAGDEVGGVAVAGDEVEGLAMAGEFGA